ncbi:pitrilysin family protein [Cohnella lubricantis]|uniref:Insulinase family protein n=1 Tax=Cohnella lubricantis TaxID=2163172 RepID=A0A841TEE2_9BACL|nr:pitrilysin family protein [Cohnella lubricantis]MBB6679654.1 insulinase family protein [Cohnella lubricantis]MBP2119896.1 putative Zn-dependent peptidase [Cohnella lubricantis]
MSIRSYPELQETLHYAKLDNGLEVFVLPKPGFTKTYATFTTRYGSVDNHFRAAGKEEVRVPDGIAHFLEHKMFEEPEGDIFSVFASQGASANAFTSFDRTVYLFSAAGSVEANLDTLLNFVQNPYFTDESVEKEKGIIIQEINMYRDNPDWRVYFGLIEALYSKHPVHIDIAGTAESVSSITKEMLYECYYTFYHPSNMSLFIVGGVDGESTIERVRANQAAKTFAPAGPIERFFEPEPTEVRQAIKESKLPVSLPKCLFGYKDVPGDEEGENAIRRELAMKLLLDALLGSSSPLYQQMYDDNLISDGFGHEYNTGPGYAFSVIGGDTRDPDELVSRITEALGAAAGQGLSVDVFERTRRKKIGAYLRMLNSPEAIAGEFTRYKLRGGDLFRVVELYESLTLDEVNAHLREHVKPERLAVSIVRRSEP